MTQRGNFQSIGLLMIVVFSAVFLWALTAVIWPVPVVYADDPEIITITVTSSLETYFHDPELDPTGGTVYFNSIGGEGAGQILTVTVTCSGTVTSFEGAPAFGETPPPDTTAPSWEITYTVGLNAETQSGIVFTATGASGTDTAVITFTQDNVDPGLPTSPQARPDDYDDVGEYDDDVEIYFTWEAANDNPDGSGIATYYAEIDDSTPDESIVTNFEDTDTGSEGLNPYYVAAVDHVGNIGPSVSDTITIDLTEPEITAITVISDSPTYFYNPGLGVAGGEVFFNSLGSEGGGQTITVTVSWNDANPYSLAGDTAFGDSPGPDILGPPWTLSYTIGAGAISESNRVFTVTDWVGNTDTAIITFTQDNTDPIIISPTLDEDSNFLHADGFTLYYGDDMATPVVFWVEGEAQDDGVGPKEATYSAAFGGAPLPRLLNPPSYHWEGSYNPNKNDWGSGTITVTISDQVGNNVIQVFTYTRDAISPTIVPTNINESSLYLHADGLTLYYSDLMGGSAQDFEVQGTASDDTEGAGFQYVTFSNAFGDSLEPVTTTLWSGVYNVASSNNGDGNIIVTAYDNVNNWSTGVFTYIEDTTNPTLTLTYITPPGYDEDEPDYYFDADGSNWYNADDFIDGNWVFTSTTADDGAGLDSGSAFWDHSANQTDQTLDCGTDGDGTFPSVSSDAEGTVTVTVTITDHVGNSTSGTVDFNIDNTKPVITSPSIYDYGSPWLHVNGLIVYYGDDMPGPESFGVQGQSTDGTGVGLDRAKFSGAFGNPPPFDDTTPITWTAHYYPDDQNWGNGTITVTVTDLLNNPATQIFTYTRDTDNPTSVAGSPQYDNGNPIVVTYTDATDTGGSDLQWVQLWYKKEISGTWANSGLPAQTGPSGSFNFIPSDGDGTYYFASVTTDNVSNNEEAPIGSGDDNTIYDTAEPSVPGDFHYLDDDTDEDGDGFLPEAGYYDDPEIKLEWNDSSDDGSGLLTPPYHLGIAPHPTGGSYTKDSSYIITVGSGVYTIYLTAEDNAGNISDDAVTGPVVLDLEAPQVDINCPISTTDPSFVVDWSATADQGPAGLRSTYPYSVSYNIDSGVWQDWIIATSAVTATFGPDSPVPVEYSHTYCFRMRVVDKAGNVSEWGQDCTEVHEASGPAEKVFLPIIVVPDSNWGFELGNLANWQHGGQLAQSASKNTSHSGSYSALLGNPSYPCSGVPVGSAWLRRSVKVPSSGSPTLSFWYRIFTQDKNSALSDDYDLFVVYINGSVEVVRDANITGGYGCSTLNDLGWQNVNFSLDGYQGQTIEITFYNYNRAPVGPTWYNTYTYIDDFSVQ